MPTGEQEVYKTRRSDQIPYRILSISNSKGIVNFFGSSFMESSRILRIAIFANTFVLLISPSAGFAICAVPAEKSKRISPHSSSSLAYRCTALYSYAAASFFLFLSISFYSTTPRTPASTNSPVIFSTTLL